MACYGGPDTEDKDLWEQKLRHNSPTADAFCELCAFLEQHTEIVLTPKAHKWWQEHKERDRQRVEAEVALTKLTTDRMNLINSLSDYEKKLLGIS